MEQIFLLGCKTKRLRWFPASQELFPGTTNFWANFTGLIGQLNLLPIRKRVINKTAQNNIAAMLLLYKTVYKIVSIIYKYIPKNPVAQPLKIWDRWHRPWRVFRVAEYSKYKYIFCRLNQFETWSLLIPRNSALILNDYVRRLSKNTNCIRVS